MVVYNVVSGSKKELFPKVIEAARLSGLLRLNHEMVVEELYSHEDFLSCLVTIQPATDR